MTTQGCSRREFLGSLRAGLGTAAISGLIARANGTTAEHPWFKTRGAVIVVGDMETYDWPALAKESGLNTLATHIRPSEIAAFVRTEAGQRFLDGCQRHGISVEHELHALDDLLPRGLFDKDPTMFRMDEKGERVRKANLCVHSVQALEVVAENAARYTRELRSTTGRYFYWIDDGQPMCLCPKCRGFSESDQALLLENHMLRAIRRVDERASLAHLAYARTLAAPTQVRPEPGIFLEFAPIERRYDTPLAQRAVPTERKNMTHGQLLDALDANLAWFGRDGAQALEYWLDVSRFSAWKRAKTVEIPWRAEVFADDLATYARRGIRHVTTFAAWLDGDYVKRWGIAPVRAYGKGLCQWRTGDGTPIAPHGSSASVSAAPP